MESGAPDQNLFDGLNALGEAELFKVINADRLAHEMGSCSVMTGWITQKQLSAAVPHKAKAILTRLQAHIAVMESEELKRWILADEASIMPAAQRALISAAANHPLSIIDGDITFEKESSFFNEIRM